MTKTITATAPVRTCDCGGWTDTWFARHGAVFHVAVNPGVRVVVRADAARADRPAPVVLHAENYGDSYRFLPGTRRWGRHALLEAAIESEGVPPGTAIEVSVRSAVPPGAATGTSAAVCVALVGALRALWGAAPTPDAVAKAAHAVEVDRLGQQSGLQDQLAAAHGGINFIKIRDYPVCRPSPRGGVRCGARRARPAAAARVPGTDAQLDGDSRGRDQRPRPPGLAAGAPRSTSCAWPRPPRATRSRRETWPRSAPPCGPTPRGSGGCIPSSSAPTRSA